MVDGAEEEPTVCWRFSLRESRRDLVWQSIGPPVHMHISAHLGHWSKFVNPASLRLLPQS